MTTDDYTPSPEAVGAAEKAVGYLFRPLDEVVVILTDALTAAVPIELARVLGPLRELADEWDGVAESHPAWRILGPLRTILDALPGEGGQP